MPRDLQTRKTLEDMPSLTSQSGTTNKPEDAPGLPDGAETTFMADQDQSQDRRQHEDGEKNTDKLMRDMERDDKINELHPYVQNLTLSDVESCTVLEEVTFPENQRCTREKFIYRFSKCNELCIGLFASATAESSLSSCVTYKTAHPPDSQDPDRRAVLLAHIVVTKTTNDVVTDQDMALPPDWKEKPGAHPELGHKEEGRTIALHSLAVLPEFQRRGLGTTLMKAYIQRMEVAEVADKIALITYQRLVPYYEKLGFKNLGKSEATFGGESWYDMTLDLEKPPPKGAGAV